MNDSGNIQTGRSSGLNETRPITGWARPLASVLPHYCGVVEIQELGSVITACRGRWARTEPMHFIEGRDTEHAEDGTEITKCGACVDVALEQRTVGGLRELRGALAIETKHLVVGIDCGFDEPSLVVVIDQSELGISFDFSDVTTKGPEGK